MLAGIFMSMGSVRLICRVTHVNIRFTTGTDEAAITRKGERV